MALVIPFVAASKPSKKRPTPPSPSKRQPPAGDLQRLLSEGYQVHATTHYRVHAKDPTTGRRVGETLEVLYDGFFRIVPEETRPKAPQRPLEAFVVPDPDEFARLAATALHVDTPNAGEFGGFYDPNSQALFVLRGGIQATLHEGTHQLCDVSWLHQEDRDTWAKEGFADFMQWAYWEGKLYPGEPNPSWVVWTTRYRRAKEEGTLLSLRALVQLPGGRNILRQGLTLEQVAVAYTQSCALVHHLVIGDGGRRRAAFFAFLAGPVEEERGSALGEARVARVQRAFGSDLDVLQREMEGMVMTFPRNPSDVPPPGVARENPR